MTEINLAGFYRNRGNGQIYQVIGQGLDCTNSRDQTPVVIYRHETVPTLCFVRERSEFADRFTEV